MLAKTALLIVSNPLQIGNILPTIKRKVQQTLYIQLSTNDILTNLNLQTNQHVLSPKYSSTIRGIYSEAALHCDQLDVRVLLSSLRNRETSTIHTNSRIDLVIFDKEHNRKDINDFIGQRLTSVAPNYDVLTLNSGNIVPVKHADWLRIDDASAIYEHAALGGTFDRLHIAHKLLLTEAVLRTKRLVTVGVTDETMLKNKLLWELCENLNERITKLRDFLTDICGDLTYDIIPISDPFGPTISDNSIELLVVSAETLRGGQKINEIRLEKGMPPLVILPIPLLDEPHPLTDGESKISSSTTRVRLLGTLLRPLHYNTSLPTKPYVIGLTGGIASGKSGIAECLYQFGAKIINCDLIGHEIYRKNQPCYQQIIEKFGRKILDVNDEIDRKSLGGIVFGDADKLAELNAIVWPAIAERVVELIKTQTDGVVVVEAAILAKAGWQKYCHEIWTTIIPKDEAIRRLKDRNGLNEEQALARVAAQSPNIDYVTKSNVVFSTLWSREQTRKQVEKAWYLLQKRIPQ